MHECVVVDSASVVDRMQIERVVNPSGSPCGGGSDA